MCLAIPTLIKSIDGESALVEIGSVERTISLVFTPEAKVGDYAFTTLIPKLGVVRHKGREFVLADIPGLIEGAAEGAGMNPAARVLQQGRGWPSLKEPNLSRGSWRVFG